jgi:hypothetical protein
MLRRIVTGGLAATLILVVLAGCGGSEASPSPSASEVASAAAPTEAPVATTAPSVEPEPSATTTVVRMLAVCAGVAIRSGPSTDDELLVRVAKLTKVRVAATVEGDPYEATTCGESGSDWVKIDRINGTSVKKLYGVPFGYGAAGFFE